MEVQIFFTMQWDHILMNSLYIETVYNADTLEVGGIFEHCEDLMRY